MEVHLQWLGHVTSDVPFFTWQRHLCAELVGVGLKWFLASPK